MTVAWDNQELIDAMEMAREQIDKALNTIDDAWGMAEHGHSVDYFLLNNNVTRMLETAEKYGIIKNRIRSKLF